MISFLKRLLNYFFLISKDDSEELRKRKILNILLLGIEFIDGLIILIYLIFLINCSPIEGIRKTTQIITLSSIAFFGGIFIFFINNYLSQKIAGIVFLILAIVLIYISDNPYELVSGRSLLELVLPIIIAGFLIKPYTSYITVFFIILINLIICIINRVFPFPIAYIVLFLIAFITWFSVINFEKSIEKYREAYKQENFYRNLFAHNTNNIFQNILMALEIYELKSEKSNNSTNKEALNLIKSQIDRGANLIRKIRKFGMLLESKRLLKEIDFKKVLEKVIENIKSSKIKKKMNISVEVLTQTTLVIVD